MHATMTGIEGGSKTQSRPPLPGQSTIAHRIAGRALSVLLVALVSFALALSSSRAYASTTETFSGSASSASFLQNFAPLTLEVGDSVRLAANGPVGAVVSFRVGGNQVAFGQIGADGSVEVTVTVASRYEGPVVVRVFGASRADPVVFIINATLATPPPSPPIEGAITSTVRVAADSVLPDENNLVTLFYADDVDGFSCGSEPEGSIQLTKDCTTGIIERPDGTVEIVRRNATILSSKGIGDGSLTTFGGASYRVIDDGRRGVGQDGYAWDVAGGLSYAFNPDLIASVATRYAKSDLSGASGATRAEALSFGVFLKARLNNKLTLDLGAAHSEADLDSSFVQPTGTFSGNPKLQSTALQALLSGRYQSGDFNIAPLAGLAYRSVHQKAFRLSDGTNIAAINSQRLGLNAGFDISHSFRNAADTAVLTHSFGVTATANLSGRDVFQRADGSVTEAGGYGLNARTGLAWFFDNGTNIGLTGEARFQDGGLFTFGLGVSAVIPF